MTTYYVETLRTVACRVEVEADTPEEAVATVNSWDYKFPPDDEWEALDGWEFIVYDEGYNQLYEER